MVILCFRCFICVLFAFPLIANALPSSQVTALFPNAGTVNTSNGRAAVVGVTSINASARTSSIVIDARDRFGNPLRLVKTATISASRLKNYMTTCLKNPVVCGGAVIVTALISQYLYTFNSSDGSVTYNTPAGSFSACVDKNLPQNGVGGLATTALGPIPCALQQNSTTWILRLHELGSLSGGNLIYSSPASWTYHAGDTYASIAPLIFYQISSASMPLNPGTSSEISEEQAANLLLSDTRAIQIQPGVFPDIFNDVPVTETATNSNVGTVPDPDNYPDPSSGSDPDPGEGSGETPPNETLMDMSAIPSHNIDVSNFLDWGSRWLPNGCPNDIDIALPYDQHVTFSYQNTCNVLNDYVGPLVQIAALISFLTIVFGGIKQE